MEEDKNYINLIRGDLTKASQAHNGMPDSVGMMNIKTANQTILEASLLPTPRARRPQEYSEDPDHSF